MPSDPAADAALETLFLPFSSGRLAWPAGSVLFLRARMGAALALAPRERLRCEQGFKPEADALLRAGLVPVPTDAEDNTRYPLILILPPRQRIEARALLSRALTRLAPGGTLVAALANNEGARSGEADLARLAGPVETMVKNKCRVWWTTPEAGQLDRALIDEWSALDAPRPIAQGRFLSRPGLFAWDRIDPASQLLARCLPATLAGRAADLGAGFGYLAAELLERCPGVAAIDLYEAEYRAVELARSNLERYASRATPGFHWHDVTAGLPQRYDVIVTNPPFHAQRGVDRPDIGRRFLAVAAEALNPGGQIWFVANRHLPYEAVLGDRFTAVTTVVQQDGFKVIAATR